LSSKGARIEHLKEHLSYEFLMMRYTYLQMSEGQTPLRWNASFAAFWVYARNLYEFLTSDRDTRNFNASDFVAAFSAKDAQKVHGVLHTVHAQVFHPGKNRVSDSERKAGLTKASKMQDWAEENMKLFVDALDEQYRQHWDPARADPAKYDDSNEPLQKGPTGPARPTN